MLLPLDYGLGSIKDPWVQRRADGGYRLYVSVDAPEPPRREGPVCHAGARDATARAESGDGLVFPALEYVYSPPVDDSWHGRRGRINCLVPVGDGWVGTLDGGRTYFDNFEEPCGLVASDDGRELRLLTPDAPWVTSPWGCVRYVWGLRVDQRLLWYFESTRLDGSHDLRVAEVTVPEGL